ncbi:L-lactate dehydrogenase complex protein LldG [Paenibacillus endophyticus]|uniref:L-lactate dehydrogenase complex protein LldG n=1 Tax=Paenibacillus endophyticus TaxID=1294268 RepID=A0A7W5G8P1_9BACL|nr:LUD domain-containing protein [Paenibacillus endophyticus]MBB3151284.1 L-lactate dehydrogenase complex protein LldG [Paenibacillus endophyticus]
MADTHKQWLEELEAESKVKQEQFMNDIASKLRHPRMYDKPNHPFRGAPDFWNAFEWSEEERIQAFTDNFLSVGGHVARLGSMDEVKSFIVQKAEEMSAKYVIRQNQPELDALGLESALTGSSVSVWNTDDEQYWRARAAEADFGIVIADHAVAYTGSVTVLSAPNKGRSVSLLPTVLIIIIPIERLKTRLGEVLVTFDEAGREQLPAGIHFISGPSRSSDIENDLTIGVHGPGIVYALLVE